MSNPFYSYNGEFVNLNNVIFAEPLDSNKIKIYMIGSAGAGNNHQYTVQHRERVLIWPRAVWDKVVEDSSHVILYNEETGKAKIS